MNVLSGISTRSKIALGIAILIMLIFFLVQTCIVFGVCENTMELAKFGYCCVILFMPPFFMVVSEFVRKKAQVVKELNSKSVYLEHAAKIIRHDMHSGINTYLPRGVKSLRRRISEEQINELKLGSTIQLIEDGLYHAQKVYSGVYEFTNLFKENSTLKKEEIDVKESLKDYLRLTSYSQQVVLNNNLPKNLMVNEPLFCTAIDNLIRNGLRYNDSDTKFVKVYMFENSIIVEDNGRGLSNEDFIKLSKPYTRGKGQSENGTGLGLNICVEILKEHRFKVRSEKTNNGTKVIIDL